MKSPLRKRIPRELKGEIGKYLVVFILMVATIGMVSGFLVADGSMIQAYDEGFEKYNIEDGNFRLNDSLSKENKKALEKDLEMDLSPFDKTVRFDNTFQTWVEVSPKLSCIYDRCGGDSIFGGIVFVDYKKYLNHKPYLVLRNAIR